MKVRPLYRSPAMLAAALLTLPFLLAQAPPAHAQVSISGAAHVHGADIGIDLPVYPELVPVPGYPVYYAPQSDANLFFYDGQYWVYQGNYWYASTWYNGPWAMVDPFDVPDFVLRVPVRYYRAPPPYFRGWRADAAPQWGEHWGPQWQQRRADWNRWNRKQAPAAAPLPSYQRNYSAARYPANPEQQREIQSRYDHRDPRESMQPQRDERPDMERGMKPDMERGAGHGAGHGERRRDGDRDEERR